MEATCTLADRFDILDMQCEADEWLTTNLKTLAADEGDRHWAERLSELLIYGGGDEDEDEDKDDESIISTGKRHPSSTWLQTRSLANAFPFLVACKEALLSVILWGVSSGHHPDGFSETQEVVALRVELRIAWEQLAELYAHRNEPREAVVRCV
jgi:hypothetical protein